ncbi:uncharacterized protein LOC119594446 isoform X2 [Penaeus monodon]|uniref:uncharacterized protein LOC119594446 isoform X2 n=1 Tax=Penaeus monodon TaxID=6687 RepID=UPI0018A71D26|nr:uncharacterized protein LOC119594446 isoform X2 [Penaeus monodon]
MPNTPVPRAGRGRERRDSATPPRPAPDDTLRRTTERVQGRGRGKDVRKDGGSSLADVGGAPAEGRGVAGRGRRAKGGSKITLSAIPECPGQDGEPSRGRRSPSDAPAGSLAASADEVPTRKTPVDPKTSEDFERHDAKETPAAQGRPQGHPAARTASESRRGRIVATLPCPAELLRPAPRPPRRLGLRGACTNFDFAKYMDKCVMVKLNGGRIVKGTLRGFDPFMNLVVDDGVEARRSGDCARIGNSR